MQHHVGSGAASVSRVAKYVVPCQDFITRAHYKRNGLRPHDRPNESTMYQWLWHETKRVPCMSRVTNKVRDSPANSKRRTFEWLWSAIQEELKERREDQSYENLTKGLKHPQSTVRPGLAADQVKSSQPATASDVPAPSAGRGAEVKGKGAQGQGGTKSKKQE